MKIYMQALPRTGEAPKYYQLMLQQDLLGSWILLKEWGQQGGRANLRKELFQDRALAEETLSALRDQQLKKGFQVMFIQGDNGR